jgi:hypothetical protein
MTNWFTAPFVAHVDLADSSWLVNLSMLIECHDWSKDVTLTYTSYVTKGTICMGKA